MLRERFPILASQTYLNSCSKGALSLEVRESYQNYLDDWERLGSPWELWVEKLEASRQAFAALIDARADEVAVTTSVSAAVSALASALTFPGGRRRVVVSDFEFPTVAQVWHAQEQRGLQVVHVPEVAGMIALERYEELIDERTALVAIAHVCYRNGVRQPVEDIIRIAHRHGALVLLDAYQSLGTMPIDAHALGVDILVGGALKYLLGSSGLAFMYLRRELLPSLSPSTTGWFAQEDIFALDPRHHHPARSARRFEFGTPPIPNLYAGLAGLALIDRAGPAQIESHLRKLTNAIKEQAGELGFRLATPIDPRQHGALIALEAQQVERLVEELAAEDIIASSRDGKLRISPHLYNTLEDIERLMEGLKRRRELLTSAHTT